MLAGRGVERRVRARQEFRDPIKWQETAEFKFDLNVYLSLIRVW
jgi:hypothetical protein